MSGQELVPIMKAVSEAASSLDGSKGGVLSDVWNGLIGDRVAGWRLRNAAKLNEKLEEELAARGVTINTENIPERFAYSWFDKATQEDVPEIQVLFAKLLANAAQGKDEALDRKNIRIVSELGPTEARMLERISAKVDYREAQMTFPLGDYEHLANSILDPGNLKDQIAFENLINTGVLGIERFAGVDDGALTTYIGIRTGVLEGIADSMPLIREQEDVYLTSTGLSLLRSLFPE